MRLGLMRLGLIFKKSERKFIGRYKYNTGLLKPMFVDDYSSVVGTVILKKIFARNKVSPGEPMIPLNALIKTWTELLNVYNMCSVE